jgi:nucleotidyltransferase substrate binding protein (TIGR01987 family)
MRQSHRVRHRSAHNQFGEARSGLRPRLRSWNRPQNAGQRHSQQFFRFRRPQRHHHRPQISLIRVSEDIRWHQRFENFERAFILLRTPLEGRASESFNQLEMEGLVQRFEYTFELAWKTLNDYLEHSGVVLPQITPNSVIKAAYAAKLIDQSETWMNMLKHRNLMSHTFDCRKFCDAFGAIRTHYLGALQQVYLVLKKERAG